MQFVHVPRICKPGEGGEVPALTGSVTLKMLTFDERYGLLESIGVESIEGLDDMKQIPLLRKLVAFSKDKYVAVDIKGADGREFKSFDDLQYSNDGHAVLLDCAIALVSAGK